MKKVVISGMVGNGLEWYDYALYGHVAGILSGLFFPTSDPVVSLIATYGVFAAGFAMRPLGALLFGWIGDRYGRKRSLAISILMMAFPTAAIGLLPTYQDIGLWAPVLLTLIRLLQGLSLGGEFSGSIAFIVEHAPDHRRGLAGSAAMFSMGAGILLGSAVSSAFAAIFGKEAFMEWAWRIPFLLGFLIGIVGLYIRLHLDESPKYLEAKRRGLLAKSPLPHLFRAHWRSLLIAMGVYLSVTIPFYTLTVFMNSLLSKFLGYSTAEALAINTMNMVVLTVLVPLSGWLSDRYGRKQTLTVLAALLALSVIPIFLLIQAKAMAVMLLGQIWFAALVGMFIGPVPALLVELFPTHIRYTGMALSYNLCAAVFGGTTPLLATWLMGKTGEPVTLALYMVLAALVTLFSLRRYR